jgi:hypothetical protein
VIAQEVVSWTPSAVAGAGITFVLGVERWHMHRSNRKRLERLENGQANINGQLKLMTKLVLIIFRRGG